MPSLRSSVILILTACGAAAAQTARPPAAMVQPVVTNYYGTQVTDDYRWMETPGSKPLAAFLRSQNNYTRGFLDAIPSRATMLKEIDRAANSLAETDSPIRAGGADFYLQTAPGQNTAKLFKHDEASGKTTLLVDPDKLATGGVPDAINYFQPSMDGRYVAYGVSAGGSEAASLHVIDSTTGADQGISVSRVEGDDFEFQPVWWLPDNKSFAYYRLPKLAAGESPNDHFLRSRVYLHHLGANPAGDGDTPLFGFGVSASVPMTADQDAVVITVPGSDYAFGVLNENESSDIIDGLYVSPMAAVMSGKPVWTQIATKADDITAFDAKGGRLYLLSYRDAPRFKIISTDLAAPDLAHAIVVVAQTDAVIKSVAVAQDALYVHSTMAGMSQISRIPYGHAAMAVKLPYLGTASGVTADPMQPGALLTFESWVKPPVVYRYQPQNGQLADTGIVPKPTVMTPGLASREVEATSYDGTLVPLSIIMRADTKLDGHNPTLIEGYGAYALELSPGFLTRAQPWLARGGIFAIAHVRGGSWFGEGWHEAGKKLTKLNTVFDFIACAQYLVDQHYTSPQYLGGEGGSAGGITIGNAIDWRPDLFAAAIDSHGMSDTLRTEFTPNGPPNIVEFGSVTNEEGFHGLYAMSAYDHVRDGVPYPAVLLETGVNDPRVTPWEVTKMAARLQAATSSGKPVLISVSYDSGHGIGSTKEQDDQERADEYAFLLWQFGKTGFQPQK